MDDHQPPIYVSEIAELFPPQGLWTEADYLSLPPSNRKVELNTGRLVLWPPQGAEHDRIAGDLAIALDQYAGFSRLGEVLFGPLPVRLWFNQFRMPDVMFLHTVHEHRKHRMWIEGAPDWIAEVVSPTTREVDVESKLAEYARAAVPETWLVDPATRTVRVYVLSADLPAYNLAATYQADETAQAVTLSGFEVSLSLLF
jgi:Uma2 family endonuclease